MWRWPFAASDLHHSLKSKYCKKIFNFGTVSKFSFLFNKIRIHNSSFNIKTAFLSFTVFLERRQMCRRLFATSDLHLSLKSKFCKKYSILEQFQNSHSYSTKLEYITVHLTSKPHFYPLPFSWKNVKCVDDLLPHKTYIILSSLNIARKYSIS